MAHYLCKVVRYEDSFARGIDMLVTLLPPPPPFASDALAKKSWDLLVHELPAPDFRSNVATIEKSRLGLGFLVAPLQKACASKTGCCSLPSDAAWALQSA